MDKHRGVGPSRSLPSFMILVPSLVPTLGPAYASEHHPGVLVHVPSLSRSGPGDPLPVLFPITRATQLHFLWQVRRAIMINIINYRSIPRVQFHQVQKLHYHQKVSGCPQTCLSFINFLEKALVAPQVCEYSTSLTLPKSTWQPPSVHHSGLW